MIIRSFHKIGFFLSFLALWVGCLLSGCGPQNNDDVPGYLEVQYTYVATGTAGTLKTLLVSKGQTIKKDQLLFRLIPAGHEDDKNPKLKRIESPTAGTVFDTYFNNGEFVPATVPVLSIIDLTKIKIIFYANSSIVDQLKLNQLINVIATSLDRPPIKAKIIFISPQAEFTPPVIYSNEEKHKLVYRIEAQPVEKSDLLLHPGQPVTIDVHAGASTEKKP